MFLAIYFYLLIYFILILIVHIPFQAVAVFILGNEESSTIADALEMIRSWVGSAREVKDAVIDHSIAEMNAIMKIFPGYYFLNIKMLFAQSTFSFSKLLPFTFVISIGNRLGRDGFVVKFMRVNACRAMTSTNSSAF
jgi:hypothetical protein